MLFERTQPEHPVQATNLKKYDKTKDLFDLVSSYKGLAGIADITWRYKGYFDKGTSNGSLWTGGTLLPLKKFQNNF